MAPPPIRMMLADVDGTLVTQDKVLTDQAIDAVDKLRQAGILFAVTSGRPPLGMEMLIEPLDLQTPIAAFNGGLIVDRDMKVIEERVLPEELVVPISDEMTSFGLSVWIYRGADWYVPDPKGPHVDREAWTVKFEPKVMDGLDGLTDRVAKIVGVSDDHDAVAKASTAMQKKFGAHVTAAASQPYYLDVTHPDANKGSVVTYLAQRYQLSNDEIATIGDMPNDMLMFADSGLSIAMGNADQEVQQAADVRHRHQRERGLRHGRPTLHPARPHRDPVRSCVGERNSRMTPEIKACAADCMAARCRSTSRCSQCASPPPAWLSTSSYSGTRAHSVTVDESTSRWNCTPQARGPTRSAWVAQASFEARITPSGGSVTTWAWCHSRPGTSAGRSEKTGSRQSFGRQGDGRHPDFGGRHLSD